MMAQSPQSRREPFKPLAPFISSSPSPLRNQINHEAVSEQQILRAKKCIAWCGCITAIISLMAVIVIVLGFTVYNVKDPEVMMNGVTIIDGSFANVVNGTSATGSSGNNVTLLADMSVKNTNAFTFKFGETTTHVFYDGTEIGEGTRPPGKAKARRTMRFNVTMHVMAAKMMESPRLKGDVSEYQALNISSFTRIDGRVKILNIFKRKVVVELNCTVGYNLTTGFTMYGDNCLRRVDLG